jgi:hypothetical protein
VKCCPIFVLAGSLAFAQSATTTSTTDFNGNRVDGSTFVANADASRAERTEVSRSINGRLIPLEQTEERVLSEDANGKVTEAVTRKYGPNGQLMSTERVLTDTQKLDGGGSKVKATTFRSDVNGRMQEAQRTTMETRKQGSTTYAETVVERPTLNDAFQAVEKRSEVTESTDGGSHGQETIYRPSGNGGFYEALRHVTEERKAGDQTTVQTAYYEPDATGTLQLARQNVSTTTKQPDGSQVTEVNLYTKSVPGVVQNNGAPEQLQEQQIIQREKRPDGGVVETLSVRRPTMADPGRLGGLQKISETVCKGKCAEDPKP